MNEIAIAFSSYAALLENLTWLKQNSRLPEDADVGLMAFQGSVACASPMVVEAFVCSMGIIKAHREQQMTLNEERRQIDRSIYDQACLLSIEFAASQFQKK